MTISCPLRKLSGKGTLHSTENHNGEVITVKKEKKETKKKGHVPEKKSFGSKTEYAAHSTAKLGPSGGSKKGPVGR